MISSKSINSKMKIRSSGLNSWVELKNSCWRLPQRSIRVVRWTWRSTIPTRPFLQLAIILILRWTSLRGWNWVEIKLHPWMSKIYWQAKHRFQLSNRIRFMAQMQSAGIIFSENISRKTIILEMDSQDDYTWTAQCFWSKTKVWSITVSTLI
jgi:hypothetical protein